jgi:dienelactone hydrolase
VEHEVVVYDGAPHSFFDRKQSEFAEASDDAWHRNASPSTTGTRFANLPSGRLRS